MGGISSSVGFFSGIDSGKLIEQLLQVEARPRTLAQNRIQQLQFQQSGILAINSTLSGLRSSASIFRTGSTFLTKAATSSDDKILTATATNQAAAGSYTFLVDRLVSTQQMLSRGFVNRDSAGVGATSVTIESTKARLDQNVSLADLNSGSGVQRGKIVITDSGNRSATIDLSRATTVSEVLEAINGNGTAQVTASVEGGRFVLRDNNSVLAAPTVAETAGGTTGASLGLTTTSATSGGVRTGSAVYQLGTNTTLQSLNDGNGVNIYSQTGTSAANFTIGVTRAGVTTNIRVNVGDVWQDLPDPTSTAVPPALKLTKTKGAATTLGDVVTRISEAVTASGLTGFTASIDSTNGRLQLVDATGGTIAVAEEGATTARDLGILTSVPATGTVNGRRLFAGLNTSLASSLNGGNGVGGDGTLNFTLRNGATFSSSVDATASVSEIMRAIEDDSGGRLRVQLNARGTGLAITDLTGGTGNLIIAGTSGADTAASLGISTGAAGVASAAFTGANTQRQYVSLATRLTDLPGGKGVGTGRFRITDSQNRAAVVDIGSDSQTLGDIVREINGATAVTGGTGSTTTTTLSVKARINSTGDGIELYEEIPPAGTAGATKIKVEDLSGTVAGSLNIKGEASGTGVLNVVNGTFERKITLSAADTLDELVKKINESKAGVTAAVIRDGSGATPFRLSLSSASTGSSGRFLFESAGADLGLQTLDVGQDSRVFFGSSDPARAVAVTASTNSIDTLIPGLRIDLKSAKPLESTTITVASDEEKILEGVKDFVKDFNSIISRIDSLTKYDTEAKKGGVLLGDATALELRANLFRTIQGRGVNVSGRYDNLAQVGISVGKGGELTLDEEAFRNALQEDRTSVETLFVARTQIDNRTTEVSPGITVRNTNAQDQFSALGVVGQIEELAKRYLDTTSGTLVLKQRSMDDQIKLQEGRIDAFTAKLESRRAILQRQFVTMEKTLGQLQSQQSAVNSIGRR